MIRPCSLKPRQICELDGVKQMISVQFFSSFELAGITKRLMTDPMGIAELYFPLTSNIEGLGETILTVSLGASQ